MKTLSQLILLGLTFLAQAQQAPTAAIELVETKVLFRGYANKILPVVSDAGDAEIIIAGKNATVEKDENSAYYVVKPGHERTAQIFVILKKYDIVDTIRTTEYRVVNLPRPRLYWGPSENGEKANIREKFLFVGYSDDVSLQVTFSVLSWKLMANDDTISGKGRFIQEAEELLKTIDSETTVEIEVHVLGPDGKIRKMTGSWPVRPWKDEKEVEHIIVD